ncbi:hypothetical protein L0337_02450 [candidate division KSB1 bacterium]|nr:hypothetical protein [candidate division KSB1 bacterium]
MKRLIAFLLLASFWLFLMACAVEAPTASDEDNLVIVEKHDDPIPPSGGGGP